MVVAIFDFTWDNDRRQLETNIYVSATKFSDTITQSFLGLEVRSYNKKTGYLQ